MTEPESLPTELILSHAQRSLGIVHLNWAPQPGAHLEHAGQTYTVLERRHRYQFRGNRDCLHKVALYVQEAVDLRDKTYVGDRWVVGDATCRYNAQSALLRCVINPNGPCTSCGHYASMATV